MPGPFLRGGKSPRGPHFLALKEFSGPPLVTWRGTILRNTYLPQLKVYSRCGRLEPHNHEDTPAVCGGIHPGRVAELEVGGAP